MKRYIIDHARYGVRTEFESLEEAIATIHACGPEFAGTTLSVRADDIRDERGDIVGQVVMTISPIGTLGNGRLDPDPTTVAGVCHCGCKTWPMDENTVWQCEQCGAAYAATTGEEVAE